MNATETLTRQLGISGTYKGYFYLVSALEMALEDEKNLVLYSKMIFPEIAKKYHSHPSRIERDIRTVIQHCWESSGKEKLQEIAPYTLYHRPTVGEFIDILYWYLKFLE